MSQQPFPSSEHEPNATPVPEQPDVSMPDPDFPETPDDPVDDNDREEQPSTEPVPHSSSSHWEWRPLTAAEEEESRQKQMKSEQVPELFPLTAEELSEDVFEMLIDFFASPGSRDCCTDSRAPEAHVYTQERNLSRPLKRRVEVSMRTLTRGSRCFHYRETERMGVVVGQEAVELVKNYLKVPRSHILRVRSVLIVRSWFPGSAFDHTSHIISDFDVRR